MFCPEGMLAIRVPHNLKDRLINIGLAGCGIFCPPETNRAVSARQFLPPPGNFCRHAADFAGFAGPQSRKNYLQQFVKNRWKFLLIRYLSP
jgi:hypothetical protein